MNIKEYFKLDYDLNIKEIMSDSRKVCEDAIFFCIKGLTNDAHKYVMQAIDNGAICIVHSDDVDKKDGITYIKVGNTMDALNKFCVFFYEEACNKLRTYGVTGTNGKTTSCYVMYDLLNKLNTKSGYIGTLGYEYDDEMHDQYFTTPDVSDLHKMLYEMMKADCKAAAIEVSSQGLDLHRTDSVNFDCAVYTNLTHDHLDYHKNFENYFTAKARLFNTMRKDGVAVINIDDPYGERMCKECSCRFVTTGIDNDATYRAINLKFQEFGSEFDLLYKNNIYPVKTNLVAKFNISNLLGVIASLSETGYALEDIIPLLDSIKSVQGRCVHINEGQNFNVIVDYAHTPDGFIKILDYAKAITPNDKKIYVVFGLRGSGDMEKRPVCGKIVDEYCDEIYITCDDNHYEDINLILDGIEEGIKNHKAHRFEWRDQAIEAAIKSMHEGDTLCILSKGNEKFYKIGDGKVPYEGDEEVSRRVLKNIVK